ncbi:MAG: CHAT domain-containing protein [Bacteroidales bacterium]|jgi:tetratricopeptide (TPR) repeat protein/CHAT domain-containing protein|nr:CHAT domain-containing protein [Bacteroidales bacterium]
MKKFILALIITGFAFGPLFSQTFEELSLKVSESFSKGDITGAVELAGKAILQAEKESGREHHNYIEATGILGLLYKQTGQYDKAEPLLKEALEIARKIPGTDQADFATALNNLAAFYFDTGIYDKAETLLLESVEIRKKSPGQSNLNYAQSLNNIGMLYQKTGDFPNAEKYMSEALEVIKGSLGTDNAAYGIFLNNLGEVYYQMGNYVKAELLYITSLNIKKRTLGPDHPYNLASINDLAYLYFNTGYYKKAEPLMLEVLALEKKTFGTEEHPLYAQSLSNLGLLYDQIGEYNKAEETFLKASEIRKQVLGPDHPDYAQTLNNLAALYKKTGSYEKAESLFIQSLDIRRKSLGTEHPVYAESLDNMAVLYKEIGNFKKAEPLYIEAVNINKKRLGPDHPDYATSLNNLAHLYSETGNYDKAEPLFIEVADIMKRAFGTGHEKYALSLNNLASLYLDGGDYLKAEPLLTEASGIIKNALGPDHPSYATSLTNMASLYGNSGDYSKAEQLFKEALGIRERTLGIDHPEYAGSLISLAIMYDKAGEYEKAEPFILKANNNLNNQIRRNFSFLSENEKEQFLENRISFHFELYNSLFLKRNKQNPSLAGISYDNELAHKGMLLAGNVALRKAVAESDDSLLVSIYDQYMDVHEKLSVLYTTPVAERVRNSDTLESVSNRLEKELIERGKDLPGVENLTGLTNLKWQDVRHALKPNEAAIEYIDFRFFNGGHWTDDIFYCALVLRKDYEFPKMVWLFEERELKKLVSTPQATGDPSYITRLYSWKVPPEAEEGGSSLKDELYWLIWQPIDTMLKDISTVYLSPSGLLYKVAFDAIAYPENISLSEKYKLNIVSSTKICVQKENPEVKIADSFRAVLYGGIEYDVDTANIRALSLQYSKPEIDLQQHGNISIPIESRGAGWPYLPGTLSEVSDIEKIFRKKGMSPSVYTGQNATEESFSHLSEGQRSPEIIHIASHGYFFPEIKEKPADGGEVSFRGGKAGRSAFMSSENPLMRSGILLAGAGTTWKNPGLVPGTGDGILTAYEVSSTDLSNTRLVVLSACETGLGDIKGSEGVYGLQRAFRMAGVQYTVMSLWQVPDEATSELMKLFYTSCLRGMNVREGFRAAQQKMRKKYDPFYWAAFVLVE